MTGANGRVLSLCDHSGVMVEPWLAGGFDATIVDLQHPAGVIEYRPEPSWGVLAKVGADVRSWPKHDARITRGRSVPDVIDTAYDMVFAFPPCTDLAVSGARWYREKGLGALIEALQVVDACIKVCEASGSPYLIENPVGQLSTYWRKPDHAFDPLDFGAYVLSGEQYTKRTHLWVGGGFVMPKKKPLAESVEPNPIHWCSPGPDRGNRRSLTPRGFAQAVYEANVDRVLKLARERQAAA